MLAPLVALQDNLGALQDVVFAHGYIGALHLSDDPGAEVYLAARDTERAAQLVELPRRWEQVGSEIYRRQLFELIVRL